MNTQYVGNCVNSFNEKGECIIPQLPFNDVTEFAIAEEEMTEIKQDHFEKIVNKNDPTYLYVKNKNHKLSYGILDKYIDFPVYFIYDENDDIHYFYV